MLAILQRAPIRKNLGYGPVNSFTLPRRKIQRPIALLKKLFVIILMCYSGRIFISTIVFREAVAP